MLEKLLELADELKAEYAWAKSQDKILAACYIALAMKNIAEACKWELQAREAQELVK